MLSCAEYEKSFITLRPGYCTLIVFLLFVCVFAFKNALPHSAMGWSATVAFPGHTHWFLRKKVGYACSFKISLNATTHTKYMYMQL